MKRRACPVTEISASTTEISVTRMKIFPYEHFVPVTGMKKNHDDIHAILKSWTPADVLRKLRKTSAGELIPAVGALRVLSSRLKRDRLFRPHTTAPQKHACKLVGIKNRLKADLKERSRTKVNFGIRMWVSQRQRFLPTGGHNTGMPDIKFINSKLNLQVGFPLGFI